MSSQIDKIRSEIDLQTKDELEKIEQDIAEKIQEINDATEKEIEKIKSSVEDKGKSESESASKRETGKARLNAKMKYLSQKEQGINQVFEEGKAKLRAITQTGDYVKILTNLVISGGVSLGGGSISLQLLKSDVSRINTDSIAKEISSKTGKDTKLTIQDDEPKTKIGGAVLFTEDNTWVDNTFESIIDRRRAVIRSQIEEILYK